MERVDVPAGERRLEPAGGEVHRAHDDGEERERYRPGGEPREERRALRGRDPLEPLHDGVGRPPTGGTDAPRRLLRVPAVLLGRDDDDAPGERRRNERRDGRAGEDDVRADGRRLGGNGARVDGDRDLVAAALVERVDDPRRERGLVGGDEDAPPAVVAHDSTASSPCLRSSTTLYAKAQKAMRNATVATMLP